jgi:hypothetical protein
LLLLLLLSLAVFDISVRLSKGKFVCDGGTGIGGGAPLLAINIQVDGLHVKLCHA